MADRPKEQCPVCDTPDNDHLDWCTPQAREAAARTSNQQFNNAPALIEGGWILAEIHRSNGECLPHRDGELYIGRSFFPLAQAVKLRDWLNKALPVETPDQYVVPKHIMRQLYNVLQDYANEATYWAPRTGGVLEGCPRGEPPTSAQLVGGARSMLRLIDRDVLKREPCFPEEPSERCAACGHLDRYHFDDGHGNVVCRFLEDCQCVHRERVRHVSPENGSEKQK